MRLHAGEVPGSARPDELKLRDWPQPATTRQGRRAVLEAHDRPPRGGHTDGPGGPQAHRYSPRHLHRRRREWGTNMGTLTTSTGLPRRSSIPSRQWNRMRKVIRLRRATGGDLR
jgi:hypothetical protein